MYSFFCHCVAGDGYFELLKVIFYVPTVLKFRQYVAQKILSFLRSSSRHYLVFEEETESIGNTSIWVAREGVEGRRKIVENERQFQAIWNPNASTIMVC